MNIGASELDIEPGQRAGEEDLVLDSVSPSERYVLHARVSVLDGDGFHDIVLPVDLPLRVRQWAEESGQLLSDEEVYHISKRIIDSHQRVILSTPDSPHRESQAAHIRRFLSRLLLRRN
jgi:hypothetical protein